MSSLRVIIMCKAPVAGCVKTRLMPDYSADEAARLHAAMATTVIERASRLFDDVVIAADAEHPFFAPFNLPVVAQGRGDLGVRMQRQAELAFADGAESVLLLGTDSPHMKQSRLQQAVSRLERCDVVLGPVEDGGYDLIAMRGSYPVFEGVPWSSGQVLVRTLANIERLGLSSEQLDESFDIDYAADIERARASGWSV